MAYQKLDKTNKNDELQDYLGPSNYKRAKRLNKIPRGATKCKNYVCIMSRGMLLGYEDALDMRNYSKTVRCTSIMAEVYSIPSNDFIQKMNVY